MKWANKARIIDPGRVYFVTSKTKNNFPYFKEEVLCQLWIEELRLCKQLKEFELYAFCLLHDHFHLLIQPSDEFDISKVMQALKKNVTQDINKIMGVHSVGENSNSRLRSVDIKPLRRRFQQKYDNYQSPFPTFKWQPSFHDHIIRDERDFQHHWNYTAYNYRKHDLPENWLYTSLHFPELTD